ncbi:MAG: hypothetical protein ACXU8N_17745 [Telluria sp.]
MNKTLLATATAALFALPLAARADDAALAARIEQLAAELDKLKAELQATKAAQAQQGAPAAPAAAAVAAAEPQQPATVITGYGEINYNRPVHNSAAAQADARRVVFGIQHRFDDKTKLVTEFEWEHAVVSSEDAGESEVEQAYIERQFANGLRGKVGLFLMPVGLLNTNHEPTAYYGVERNFVETAIIPTTWREAGVGLTGETENGLTWDAGITTGFDLTKWEAASEEGRESPLGAIHQEGQLAKSRDLSVHGALNWRGVPGLLVGGSVFSGKAAHGAAGFPAPDARVTLWDLHTRWTPGAWDLAALYARGHIGGVDTLNLTFAGNPNPVPSAFYGWYGQAAYNLPKWGDYALSPFMRYERFNTAARFTAFPAGLEPQAGVLQNVTTIGANLRVGEGVVLKADYQKFGQDKTLDRLNLGAGFSF